MATSAAAPARSDASAVEDIKELIVVPDGKVWYLPMEVLQVGQAGRYATPWLRRNPARLS